MNTNIPFSDTTTPTGPGEIIAMTGPVVGVRTTRIYCRPICRPGRAPKPENCTPFPDGTTARAAGYRACKQCRPDDPTPPSRRAAHNTDVSPTIRHGVGGTPVGFAFVGMTDRGLCSLYLQDTEDPALGLERLRRDFPGAALQADSSVADGVVPRIVAHLTRGEPCDDLALDLRGSPFRLRVWDALRAVPWGATTTYGALAATLGLPAGSARAVGSACGANPVSLLVPCHRVVRSGGGLGGYYWGLDRKRALLELEGGRGSAPH